MFEIGDKVIYHGADKAAYKREGTIVSIEDKDGKPQLVVELDGGGEFTAPIDDWSRKINNAKACNAGKAMVARRGRYWYYAWADGSQNGEEGPFQTEEQATIAAKQDGFKIANACTSTNSVVRNAMAAQGVVANASRYEEKSFGNGEVKVSLSNYGSKLTYVVDIYKDGFFPALLIGGNGKKSVADARAVLSALERKTSAMKQAIAWLEQKAKNW